MAETTTRNERSSEGAQDTGLPPNPAIPPNPKDFDPQTYEILMRRLCAAFKVQAESVEDFVGALKAIEQRGYTRGAADEGEFMRASLAQREADGAHAAVNAIKRYLDLPIPDGDLDALKKQLTAELHERYETGHKRGVVHAAMEVVHAVVAQLGLQVAPGTPGTAEGLVEVVRAHIAKVEGELRIARANTEACANHADFFRQALGLDEYKAPEQVRGAMQALIAERDTLRRELDSEKQAHDVGKSFHDLAVKERDLARAALAAAKLDSERELNLAYKRGADDTKRRICAELDVRGDISTMETLAKSIGDALRWRAESHVLMHLVTRTGVSATSIDDFTQAVRRHLGLGATPQDPSTADLLDAAWGIIANAWGGDWSKALPPWREAAERWRDAWVAATTAVRVAAIPDDAWGVVGLHSPDEPGSLKDEEPGAFAPGPAPAQEPKPGAVGGSQPTPSPAPGQGPGGATPARRHMIEVPFEVVQALGGLVTYMQQRDPVDLATATTYLAIEQRNRGG